MDSCRVELEFIFEDENYRVIREMKGKTLITNATATINGKIAATSAEGVNQFIQKKLGLDFKSFYTSIFAKQKELNTLSSMNPSERRPLILRMLGIDSLDEVIKEIKTDKKNKEKIIEKLSNDLKAWCTRRLRQAGSVMTSAHDGLPQTPEQAGPLAKYRVIEDIQESDDAVKYLAEAVQQGRLLDMEFV